MKKFNTGIFLAVALCTLGHATQASTYYTREEITRCENQEVNAGLGALAGGLAGAGIGLLASGGQAVFGAVGGVTGAVAGGLIGAGLSCETRSVYINRLDERLTSVDYQRSYEDDRCRIVVLRAGYSPRREYCRAYRMDFVDAHGHWVTEESTACWIGGRWRYGYANDVIAREHWRYRHPVPPVRVVEAYHPRWDPDYYRDRQRYEHWRREQEERRYRAWREREREERHRPAFR